MYWKIGDKRTAVLTVPLYTIGNEQAFSVTLVTESEEQIDAAYLFTAQPLCIGLLQAKRASDVAYMAIMGPFDANCFLGHVSAQSEVTIDFLLYFPESHPDGYTIVPVMVGHGAVAQLPNPYFTRDWPELWHDDWPDLWREEFLT